MNEGSEFRAALSAAMKSRGLSQQALADEVDVTQGAVHLWLAGKSVPTPERVFAVERALGLAPGRLSARLGYVPAAAVSAPSVGTPEEAIAADPTLSKSAKRALLTVLRTFRES